MGLRINDIVPNFIAETDQGQITFHDWIGDSWEIGRASCRERV